MATILVTGSSDGIGRQTASTLAADGHRVVLHARNEERAAQALAAVPQAAAVVRGDLTSLAETREVAQQAAAAGPFDVVIHNAGIGGEQSEPVRTGDGLEQIFQVNVLAPYLLTALLPWPARLVYLTSGLRGRRHRPARRPAVARSRLGRDAGVLPTRSSMTCCWPSRSRGAGRRCSATRWIPAGSVPGWAGRARPTGCPPAPTPDLARDQRRAGRHGHRPLLQAAPRAAGQPGGLPGGPAGGAAGGLRRAVRGQAAGVSPAGPGRPPERTGTR